MTPEEKAEEYVKEQILKHNRDVVLRPKNAVTYIDELKQAYLDGHAEGFDAGYKKATERSYERQQDLTDTYIKDGEKIKQLEKENAELKAQIEELQFNLRSRNDLVEELTMLIEKMKKSCLDVMQVQGNNLTDDYMAGMYNGMVVVYNSYFLKGDELEKNYCSKNEHNKWELAE